MWLLKWDIVINPLAKVQGPPQMRWWKESKSQKVKCRLLDIHDYQAHELGVAVVT